MAFTRAKQFGLHACDFARVPRLPVNRCNGKNVMEQTSSKVTTAKTHNTRALWNLTRGQRRRFALAGVALVIGTVFMFVGPQIVRFAIDAFLDRSKPAGQLPDWMARGQAMLDATARPYRALFLAALGVFIASLISFAGGRHAGGGRGRGLGGGGV